MNQAHETLPLRELIAVLQTLCRERQTGTMFLHTDTNHSARIGIERGRIFSISYGRYRGMDAIEQFKRMKYGKFSFAESIFNNAAEIPLPPTGELLNQLNGAAIGDPPADAESAGAFEDWIASPKAAPNSSPKSAPGLPPLSPKAAPKAAPAPIPGFGGMPLPGVPAADWADSDEVLRLTGARLYDAVAEALALSIGPVASVVCDDYREQLVGLGTPAEFRAIAARIATETGSDEEGARFLARVLAKAGLAPGR